MPDREQEDNPSQPGRSLLFSLRARMVAEILAVNPEFPVGDRPVS